MAVLIEGISVVTRASAVHDRYPGGWEQFARDVPNSTLVADNELIRVGFMVPQDVQAYIRTLCSRGLVHLEGTQSVDIVVVDQLRGPLSHCEWLEFGSMEIDDSGNSVMAARLKDSKCSQLLLPDGWKYEDSLSHSFGFVPTGEEDRSLVWIRNEGGTDVFLNQLTGEEVYIGRSGQDLLTGSDFTPGDTKGTSARNGVLTFLPCVDSPEMGRARRRELDMSRSRALSLGESAVEASRRGHYQTASGETIDWSAYVKSACQKKISIAPDAPLPESSGPPMIATTVQVVNLTTLQAGRSLVRRGIMPLALNFANGIYPGGGFLNGARAQEEGLCRSSALYSTLVGDPMYDYHRSRPHPDSSDWAIYSPDVPVFRTDDGSELREPWLMSFLTSAAPVAHKIGQPLSRELLRSRITRVLSIASAYGHRVLILGAWGCGAFGNDPHTTAVDFRTALESQFAGHFSEIIFAITDWSPERKTLGPFRDVFSAD